MKVTTSIYLALLSMMSTGMVQAQTNVDVNLNIKHSVDGISDFGRDRHMTIHSTPTDGDWKGNEDMMDYLINDLDVYFGRDNGSSTWKFKMTPQDPLRANKPNLAWMATEGERLKGLYESETLAHQFENKGAMIMGTNVHPLYPTLNWNATVGFTSTGWQPQDVDASTEWVVQYLDKYFSKGPGDLGEPLPKYWEVVNEIDMFMMTGTMTCTSQEKIWEYHNLVAKGVKERLGDKAPKIGGMTWGLHDLYKADGLSRYPDTYYDQWLTAASKPFYHNMIDSKVNATKASNWYQWDVMWQGFMDATGANMDFHSIHIYDWPKWEAVSNSIRAGGHTEAMLDMIEWYDNYKFGTKKEVVISEYGAVSAYIDKPGLDPKRRDWENLKPFNSMLMQFLERPSQVVLSMPFTPIKAEWGDYLNADGSLKSRYPYTMMDKDASGKWQWSEFIKFFELWSDVDGTRIDTKSSNNDIQVDAYVKGNHVYLILNNLLETSSTIQLNFFDDYANKITNVRIKDLYLDETIGTVGAPVLATKTTTTAPGSITLKGDATMILDYTFESAVTINQTSVEKKYMNDRLTSTNNAIGGILVHTNGTTGTFTAKVNNVSVPTGAGEAVLRIGGRFWKTAMKPSSVTVNGHALTFDGNWRGTETDRNNVWFGVIEIPVPLEYLQASNTITCLVPNSVDYTTVMLQVWDFSKKPGRAKSLPAVPVTSIGVNTNLPIMVGESKALTATITPTNATNTGITWSTSDATIATVDEFGIVTAKKVGNAIITATSKDGNKVATCTVNPTAFVATKVTGITITEGANIDLDYYVTTKLNATVLPSSATHQTIVWSTADASIVSVDAKTGKLLGKKIGQSTTITATLTDVNNSNQVHIASITAKVGIVGDEAAYCTLVPNEVDGNTNYIFDVPININGERSIVLELKEGATIVGTTTKVVNSVGTSIVPVSITLASVPTFDKNYTVKVSLKSGTTLLFESEKAIKIKDVIHPQSITLVEWLRVVQTGKTLPIKAIVAPENTYNKTITWSTSNKDIATVSEDGIITGVTAGAVTITAKCNDNGLETSETITVQNEVVKVEPVQIIMDSKVNMLPSSNKQLSVEFLKEWTTEKGIDWSSSDPTIASVDVNGLVTSTSKMGQVTITAKALNSPSVLATCKITVSGAIIVEAEDYTSTGGSFSGFTVYTVNNVKAINNNQTGDWADYKVSIPEAGYYSIEYFVGTNVTGAAVEFILNGTSQMKTTVSNNGNWDAFVSLKPSKTVYLEAGIQTIRLQGAGTNGWEWNMDRFTLTNTSSTPSSIQANDGSIAIKIYPNPAHDYLNISLSGALNSNSSLAVYNTSGVKVISETVTSNTKQLSLNNITSGLYIIQITNGTTIHTEVFIKQ